MSDPNYLDGKLFGVRTIKADGVELVERSIVNFKGGPAISDNPVTEETDVDFGTGVWTTLHGNVDFHNAAITATGNPTWDTGTGTFTVGGTTTLKGWLYFDAALGSPTICQNQTAAHGVIGQTMTIEAQNVLTDGAPGSTGGTLLLKGGPGYGADDIGGHVIVMGGHGLAGLGSVRLRDGHGNDRVVADTNVTAYGTASVNLGVGATWRLAVQAASVFLNLPNLTFQGDAGNVNIAQSNAVVDTAASSMVISSQPGGAASTAAGKKGGWFCLKAGDGGAGTAVYAAGDGGDAVHQGGSAGANNGGGGGTGGQAVVQGGTGIGLLRGGSTYIRGGDHATPARYGDVVIGDSYTITTSLHSPVDFHCSAVTATGNPTWNTGTGTFTFGTALVQIASSVTSPILCQADGDLGHGVIPQNINLHAQSNSHADTPLAGHMGMTFAVEPVGSTKGNLWLGAVAANWQAMRGGIHVSAVDAEPTGNPAAGCKFVWSDAFGLKCRDEHGVVSLL